MFYTADWDRMLTYAQGLTLMPLYYSRHVEYLEREERRRKLLELVRNTMFSWRVGKRRWVVLDTRHPQAFEGRKLAHAGGVRF